MATRGADEAVSRLYAEHWAGLVRLATLLLRDQGRAEEVVQDAFVALHRRWSGLQEPVKAVAYLRRSVVNGCRSTIRHRVVVDRQPAERPGVAPSAEASVLVGEQRSELVEALRRLPRRQREVLVLRYFSDLSEADIAATLGISRGAVKSHSARGIAALKKTWGARA